MLEGEARSRDYSAAYLHVCILFEAMPSGRSHPRYDAVFHSLIEANVEADVRSHDEYCISDCSSQIHESLRPAWSAAFAHSLSMSDVGGL